MVYIDGSNITADTEPELHLFAKAYHISQSWYVPNEGRYPVFGNLRKCLMRDIGPKLEYISKEKFAEKTKALLG